MSLRPIRLSAGEQASAFEQRLNSTSALQGCQVACIADGASTLLYASQICKVCHLQSNLWPLQNAAHAQVTAAEAKEVQLLLNRDHALKHGVKLEGKSFEVHQHCDEYMSGRQSADGVATSGFVCIKSADKLTGRHVHTVAIFALPQTAAEVAPALREACRLVFERGVLRDFFQNTPRS